MWVYPTRLLHVWSRFRLMVGFAISASHEILMEDVHGHPLDPRNMACTDGLSKCTLSKCTGIINIPLSKDSKIFKIFKTKKMNLHVGVKLQSQPLCIILMTKTYIHPCFFYLFDPQDIWAVFEVPLSFHSNHYTGWFTGIPLLDYQ